MFEKFYGMKILDTFAYGIDEFDFTPNLVGFGTSVGETGYAVLKFENGVIYLSTDGITTEKPVRENVHELQTGDFRRDMVGKTLLAITREDRDESKLSFTMQLEDCYPIECYLEETDGHCDRNYFSLESTYID